MGPFTIVKLSSETQFNFMWLGVQNTWFHSFKTSIKQIDTKVIKCHDTQKLYIGTHTQTGLVVYWNLGTMSQNEFPWLIPTIPHISSSICSKPLPLYTLRPVALIICICGLSSKRIQLRNTMYACFVSKAMLHKQMSIYAPYTLST